MGPFSTLRPGLESTGVQAERQKEMSEYRRILSPTRSLHDVVVVVKGAGIHLGRKHEETILVFLGKRWKKHNNPSFLQKAWDKMSVIKKNSNSHLSVSGWGHELELRGVHKDRAVWRTIHVIKQGSGGAL